MKKILILIPIAIVFALVSFFLYKENFKANKELPAETKNLILVHDSLVQNRLLFVQLLTADTENSYETGELLSYFETSVKESREKISTLSEEGSLIEHSELFKKTDLYLEGLEDFVAKAKSDGFADRQQALTLLTDLTNLTLEYRFVLEQLGYQFPPLPPLQ